MNFWSSLPKPIVSLAPMEDVTDYAFRELLASKLPKPDVFFTEFTSSDGLVSRGKEKVMQKLKYSKNQRPIVAQIWGNNPYSMQEAALLVQKLGFDGVDINMGCPQRDIMKRPAGAGLIGQYDIVEKIIKEIRKKVKKIPLSIKTRLGSKIIDYVEWCTFLLEQNIDTLTIHGRTPSQMSQGDVNWEGIGEIVKIKDKISPKTIILGNGDVKSYKEVITLTGKYGLDGIMIGRGIFSNPWVFEKTEIFNQHTKEEHLSVLIEHLDLFEKTWGETKNPAILKKFFKMYVNGFRGASKLRSRLMNTTTNNEVRGILQSMV